jgi:hypothetical protein
VARAGSRCEQCRKARHAALQRRRRLAARGAEAEATTAAGKYLVGPAPSIQGKAVMDVLENTRLISTTFDRIWRSFGDMLVELGIDDDEVPAARELQKQIYDMSAHIKNLKAATAPTAQVWADLKRNPPRPRRTSSDPATR